jgi:hypothetical protein
MLLAINTNLRHHRANGFGRCTYSDDEFFREIRGKSLLKGWEQVGL